MTASHLKVAVAQLDVKLGDIQNNLERHAMLAEEARQGGARLVLFPELSLTGYGLGQRVPDLAMRRDDPRLRELSRSAGDLTLVLGFVEEGPAAQFYNATAAWRAGEMVFLHRKLNLPTYGNLEEGKYFAGGRFITTFRLDDQWTVATLICADLWNPALVHLALLHGATLLLAPINSALDAVGGDFSNPQGWRLVTDFYATIYGLPVLMSNRVGTEGAARFWGGSRVVDPRGRLLCEGDGSEQVLFADLDYDTVRRARFLLPTVRDANLHLVQREINRLADQVGVPQFVLDQN